MLSAAGEHSADEQDGRGYSDLKALLERENYKVRTESPAAKSVEAGKGLTLGQQEPASNVEIGKDCTALVIGGPKSDYPAPVVSAIEKYVEGGGRALILLDTTLRLGNSEPPSENEELDKVLGKWGVTPDKDLVLDLSGFGGLFNLGPEVPFIISYDSHPITQPLTRIPTAYPLARSLEVKSTDKTSVTKLVDTTDRSVGTDSISHGRVDTSKGKKGPLTLAAAGTYNGSPQGRFVVVGTSYAAENTSDVLVRCSGFAASRCGDRILHLVEKALGNEAGSPTDGICSPGNFRGLVLVVEQKRSFGNETAGDARHYEDCRCATGSDSIAHH
ncbi:MAG: hypothetical protein DMG37_23460 [Acidobacteria bacterium]|nr:MAG: hypothetical protein DMG37_23460 [Acidobacteriota bacterium]